MPSVAKRRYALAPVAADDHGRRLLVNFRIDPDALAAILPAPFEPRTVGDVAIGGVCCLRLRNVRPRGVPAAFGIDSENAAHRFGVEWEDDDGERQAGVYVPRRDTSSRLVERFGSRTFGRHGLADFEVTAGDGRYGVSMRGRRDDTRIRVSGTVSDDLPADSVFDAVPDAAGYHECGTRGYSPAPDGSRFDCLAVTMDDWPVCPLAVDEVEASFLERNLAPDDYAFDNALLVTDVETELRPEAAIRVASDAPAG